MAQYLVQYEMESRTVDAANHISALELLLQDMGIPYSSVSIFHVDVVTEANAIVQGSKTTNMYFVERNI